jgi:flagellar motor switch protein FliG
MPIEEKAKFEKALEERANNVLLYILGPNRARVVVDATLDFTRTEKFEVKNGAELDKNSMFLWQNVGAQTSGPELLPGIPSQEPLPNVNTARSYERSNSFPAAFVKALKVTVIVDSSVDVTQRDMIRRALTEALNLQAERKDEKGGRIGEDIMDVVPANFAPAWKTIWYTPESAGLLFKYALISLMTLITLIVVAACFLKLAEAMDSMAQAQAHQLQMDFGQKEGAGAKEEEGAGEEKKEESREEIQQTKIVFNVKPEQIETLLELVRGQDPENIALITAHLPPEVKKDFLRRLATSVYSEVIFHLGRVKFIDQEVVATIKDELERRLESAVGGRSNLLEMVEASDLKSKRELLRLLEERDPDMAQELRQKILLFEDLAELEEKDWSLVFSVVTLEEWAFALYDAPEEVVEALKSQMLPKTWAILSQMMQVGRPSEGAIEQSHEKIVGSVWKLVAEGRITNPITRRIEKMVTRSRDEGPPPMLEGAPELAS